VPDRQRRPISTLKRGYGWDRTRLDGTEGARIWTGHGILAHNLAKIAALASSPCSNPQESPATPDPSGPISALRVFQVEVAR